jgi:hypothetical protein
MIPINPFIVTFAARIKSDTKAADSNCMFASNDGIIMLNGLVLTLERKATAEIVIMEFMKK